jgi:hypothetical protein
VVARAELSTPPGQKNYFFFPFLAFFAFFAFFAFLAIVSSQGFNGLKRDTRGMLGGGPASQKPRLTTQQIRGALASHCHGNVIALSTAVMHFRVLFAENARPHARTGADCRSRELLVRKNRSARHG